MFRHAMREGTVPHICSFCGKEKTYSQYIIGVTNKHGEKYTVTFPGTLKHYLEPNPEHPWKLFYYPPKWFIDDLMDAQSQFYIPPSDEHLQQVRGVGYLTSLSGMSKQYEGNLPDSPKKCLEEKKLTAEDIVDTQGTDSNLGRETAAFDKTKWLANFDRNPLPTEFYHHLEKIMSSAYHSYEFDKKLETSCIVELNFSSTKTGPSYKPTYVLEHNKETNKWSLNYTHHRESKEINLRNIPNLFKIIKDLTDPKKLAEKIWEIEDAIRMYHITASSINLIPKHYDIAKRQISLNFAPSNPEVETFEVLDSDDFEPDTSRPLGFFSSGTSNALTVDDHSNKRSHENKR